MVTFNNSRNRKKDRGYPNTNQNDIIAIDTDSLKEEDRRIYICLYCRRYLVRMSDEEYYCNNCNIPFWPIRDKQQLREKQKLTTPKGMNKETLVSVVPDDPNEMISSTNY